MLTLVPWMVFTAALIFATAVLRQHGAVAAREAYAPGGGVLWWICLAASVGLFIFPFWAGMRFASDSDPSPVTTLVSTIAAGGIAFAFERWMQRLFAARIAWLETRRSAKVDPIIEGDLLRLKMVRLWRLQTQLAMVALTLCALWLISESGQTFLDDLVYGYF